VWIWLALDATTRQVVAIHAGGRSEQDAKAFWAEVPEPYRSGCDFFLVLMPNPAQAANLRHHFRPRCGREKRCCRR
jgi:IS1 family transposase